MMCLKCNSSLYMQSMSKGTCEICGKYIKGRHKPCPNLCKECADEKELCEQCGGKLEKNTYNKCVICGELMSYHWAGIMIMDENGKVNYACAKHEGSEEFKNMVDEVKRKREENI